MKQKILDINIDFDLSYSDVISRVEEKLSEGTYGKCVCTTNPEFIVDAQTDIDFKNIINTAFLSVPDGFGVLYARKYINLVSNSQFSKATGLSRFMNLLVLGLKVGFSKDVTLNNTITGVELTEQLCATAADKGYTVGLLGGSYDKDVSGDMATDTAEILKNRYPGLKVIFATSEFSRDKKDDESTLAYINSCMKQAGVVDIDLLFVAYNHVHQEKWITRNAYKIPAKVSIGVGGTFAYITGYQRIEPKIYKRFHLSWLYRLFTQPRRLRRVMNAFPIFPLKVFLNEYKNIR